MTLSHTNFERARDFIFTNGGDIDRAWFFYQFERADSDAFLRALGGYQQENGGFGGLYYEFDYAGACLKSTEVAVRYLLAMDEKPSADHPLVRRTMDYLLGEYLPDFGNWGEVVVPAVNDGVHCHWVRWRGEDTSPIADENERIRRYSANEKACFAAFVSAYRELVPEGLCREILRCPTEHLLRHWDEQSPDYRADIFDTGAPYDLEYFQLLVPSLDDDVLKKRLSAILSQNPTAFMELDFTRSDHDYVHLPCDVVASPDSVIYPAAAALVEASLDYRIRQQAEDGRWPLGWSFGCSVGLRRLQTKYEACRTLGMLVKLKRFGRIE